MHARLNLGLVLASLALTPSLGPQAEPDELDERTVFVDMVVLPPITTPAG